ncbi:putative nuclease HARBI1 [Ochlerotatus camptorhynchus]|uniref:putative nuclease HARBI1 n=1 Tax=Ochlerotatus camptorhynchus TaxID=644619 RepID=UPI0031DAF2AB
MLRRRELRDNSDPFSLSENDAVQYFRLSRKAFKFLLNVTLFPPTSRYTAMPSVLKLATTINLLASGSYQVNVGLIGMAQPSVSLVFNEVILLLERTICENLIKLDPVSFFDKFKIPRVVGCIDGTHIPILRPDEHMYFNWKGFHSINAMMITDHNYRILAVNPCYGGAARDSFVWSMSEEREYFEENFRNGQSRLLGDSGYGLAPWLLTPYRIVNEGSGEETLPVNKPTDGPCPRGDPLSLLGQIYLTDPSASSRSTIAGEIPSIGEKLLRSGVVNYSANEEDKATLKRSSGMAWTSN